MRSVKSLSSKNYRNLKFIKFNKNLDSSWINQISRRSMSSKALSINTDVINQVETFIDTPLSHFEIRNLIKDEYDISKFTLEKVSKLKDHPIVDAAKDIFDHSIGLGGFTLLLLGKLVSKIPSFKDEPEIWNKQKIFAECYEVIDKAMYIHHKAITDGELNQEYYHNGNKLAILGGDYLFSFGIIRLASMVKRAKSFDFVGASIDEYCINHFMRKKLLWDQLKFTDWEKYGGYCSSNLMAYCSQFMVILAGLTSIRYEKSAFDLGYYLRLKWNLQSDIENLTSSKNQQINNISAPVLFHAINEPQFAEFMNDADLLNEDSIKEIKKQVLNGKALEQCEEMIGKYMGICIQALDVFPDGDIKQLLHSIIMQ